MLPGLDLDLADEAWAEVGEQHPQGALKRLLDRGRRRPRPRCAPGRRRRPSARRPLAPAADQRGAAPGRGHRRLAARRSTTLRAEGASEGVDPIAEGLRRPVAGQRPRPRRRPPTAAALLLREALETPGAHRRPGHPRPGAGPPGHAPAGALGRGRRLLGRRARWPAARAACWRAWWRAPPSIRSTRSRCWPCSSTRFVARPGPRRGAGARSGAALRGPRPRGLGRAAAARCAEDAAGRRSPHGRAAARPLVDGLRLAARRRRRRRRRPRARWPRPWRPWRATPTATRRRCGPATAARRWRGLLAGADRRERRPAAGRRRAASPTCSSG